MLITDTINVICYQYVVHYNNLCINTMYRNRVKNYSSFSCKRYRKQVAYELVLLNKIAKLVSQVDP